MVTFVVMLSVGEKFLQYHKEMNFPRGARCGGLGSVVNFTNDVKCRGFRSWLSNVPPLLRLPWKKSNLVFSRARIRATAESFSSVLKSSPIELLASLACSPLLCCGIEGPFWSLHVQSASPGTWQLGPHGRGENKRVHWASIRYWARKSFVPLGLGHTGCIFKLTNQLPGLWWALGGFTPPSWLGMFPRASHDPVGEGG